MNVFTPERVTLDISRATYERLMVALGFHAGGVQQHFGNPALYRALALANELNEGNPDWTPYKIPEDWPPNDSGILRCRKPIEEPPKPCFTYKPPEETP
jgi:hypothetical protein